MELNCNLTLDADFSARTIFDVLSKAKELGYRFHATDIYGDKTISTDISEIVEYLMLGEEKPSGLEDWAPQIKIKSPDGQQFGSLLLFLDESKKLKPYFTFDADTPNDAYHEMLKLFHPFNIYHTNKLIAYNHWAKDAIGDTVINNTFKRPAIGLKLYSGTLADFLHNFSNNGCSLQFIEERRDIHGYIHQQYKLTADVFTGEIILDDDTFWFLPNGSYIMREYGNGLAIDTLRYIEFLFKHLNNLELYYLETFNFDESATNLSQDD